MKMPRNVNLLFCFTAFMILKGDNCDGEVKSVSQVSCTDDGRLSLDIAPGECLVLAQACAPVTATNTSYNSNDFDLTPQWTEQDWLTLQEDESGTYLLCAAEETPLGQSAQVELGVNTKGTFMAAADMLLVDVNVLGWNFTVETPSLTDHYIEEGMRFTVQSMVVGRSGIVSFDFRTERVSTNPCAFPIKEPATSDSPIEFFDAHSEQYWAEAYVPAGIEAGCYRVYGVVTPAGAAVGREDFKEFTVSPGVQAVIDIDMSEFVIYNSDVVLGSAQSTPSNGLRTWKVTHKQTPSSNFEEVPHYMEEGDTRFVLEYILGGTYKISLTVTDPKDSSATHTTDMEIHVSH